MQSASAFIGERFGHKRREKIVLCRKRFYNGTVCDVIVNSGYRGRISEIYFVLSGTSLVLGTLRAYAHFTERKAYLTSYISALVAGGNIHIPRVVKRRSCGISVRIAFEKIKFAFDSDFAFVSEFEKSCHRFFQRVTKIAFERRRVCMTYVAKKVKFLFTRS